MFYRPDLQRISSSISVFVAFSLKQIMNIIPYSLLQVWQEVLATQRELNVHRRQVRSDVKILFGLFAFDLSIIFQI